MSAQNRTLVNDDAWMLPPELVAPIPSNVRVTLRTRSTPATWRIYLTRPDGTSWKLDVTQRAWDENPAAAIVAMRDSVRRLLEAAYEHGETWQ